MTSNILDDFSDRARKGDGQFAIAYALLRVAESHNKLATELCFGSTSAPGVLENVGIQLAEVAKAIKGLADMSRD